jgi:hypothetical protein
MMNECWLQFTEKIGITFDVHISLRGSGIETTKRIFDHRPREAGESKNARPWRVNE